MDRINMIPKKVNRNVLKALNALIDEQNQYHIVEDDLMQRVKYQMRNLVPVKDVDDVIMKAIYNYCRMGMIYKRNNTYGIRRPWTEEQLTQRAIDLDQLEHGKFHFNDRAVKRGHAGCYANTSILYHPRVAQNSLEQETNLRSEASSQPNLFSALRQNRMLQRGTYGKQMAQQLVTPQLEHGKFHFNDRAVKRGHAGCNSNTSILYHPRVAQNSLEQETNLRSEASLQPYLFSAPRQNRMLQRGTYGKQMAQQLKAPTFGSYGNYFLRPENTEKPPQASVLAPLFNPGSCMRLPANTQSYGKVSKGSLFPHFVQGQEFGEAATLLYKQGILNNLPSGGNAHFGSRIPGNTNASAHQSFLKPAFGTIQSYGKISKGSLFPYLAVKQEPSQTSELQLQEPGKAYLDQDLLFSNILPREMIVPGNTATSAQQSFLKPSLQNFPSFPQSLISNKETYGKISKGSLFPDLCSKQESDKDDKLLFKEGISSGSNAIFGCNMLVPGNTTITDHNSSQANLPRTMQPYGKISEGNLFPAHKPLASTLESESDNFLQNFLIQRNTSEATKQQSCLALTSSTISVGNEAIPESQFSPSEIIALTEEQPFMLSFYFKLSPNTVAEEKGTSNLISKNDGLQQQIDATIKKNHFPFISKQDAGHNGSLESMPANPTERNTNATMENPVTLMGNNSAATSLNLKRNTDEKMDMEIDH